MICEASNIQVDLTGRTLTLFESDPSTEREYTTRFELDSVAAGLVLGQILSTMEIITPDSIVGAWLQQAFDNGLKQGHADEREQYLANANLCGPPGSQHFCELGCCGEE